MRVQKKTGVVSLFLLGGALSLGLLDFAVTGQDKPANTSNRKSLRTFGDVLGSMDQAIVSEDFDVWLYTNDQVEKKRQKKAAQNKRHEEYTAKRKLLHKRTKEMNGKLSKNFTKAVSYSGEFFKQNDRDRNGIREARKSRESKERDTRNSLQTTI